MGKKIRQSKAAALPTKSALSAPTLGLTVFNNAVKNSIDQAPTSDVQTNNDTVTKPVPASANALSLGGGFRPTIGMNKSGKPWKKCSVRSAFRRPYIPKSFAQKKAEAEKLKEIRERANAIT